MSVISSREQIKQAEGRERLLDRRYGFQVLNRVSKKSSLN